MNRVPPTHATEDGNGYRAFRDRIRGSNINQQPLLATDYLNHFNEIVMTLEMIPDMPELVDDARAWRPKTYEAHFRDSAFPDRDLAIAAYARAPARFREPFEATVGQMNRLVAASVMRIERDLAVGDRELVRVTCKAASRLLQKLMDHASATIHGNESTMDQAEIDALLG